MHLKTFTAGLILLASGCDSGEPLLQPAPNSTTPASTTPATVPPSMPVGDAKPVIESAPAEPKATPGVETGNPPAADDTAVNARDRDPNAKTPIDQNENPTDIQITADIRKRVVNEKDFSINAQNIKIITADGKVTLRGPVKSELEHDTIVKIAHDVAGKDHVDDQIEVAP